MLKNKVISVNYSLQQKEDFLQMSNELKHPESIDKAKYKAIEKAFQIRLSNLQLETRELGIPIMIVTDGFDPSEIVKKIQGSLDTRYSKVFSTTEPNEDEKMRPFMWRFWNKTPGDGQITILNKSWYKDLAHLLVQGHDIKNQIESIRSFEQTLTDDGTVIIKLFMDVSKDEQRDRLKKLEKHSAFAFKVTEQELEESKHHKTYKKAHEQLMKNTNTDQSDWVVIPGDDMHFAKAKALETIIKAMEKAIAEKKSQTKTEKWELKTAEEVPDLLSNVDQSKRIDDADYKRRLNNAQERLEELHGILFLKRIPLIVAYEGSDAAGKGGNIGELTKALDPRGYDSFSTAAPSTEEKSHNHLWRFMKNIPKDGHIAIFDRTWYGRVLVELVEGFCTKLEGQRAYKEINDMEKQLTDHGAIVLKYWLQITPEEQTLRFNRRANSPNPSKRIKLTDEDIRNQAKLPEYNYLVNKMVAETSTEDAKWKIIPGNDKHLARVLVLEDIIAQIEKKLEDLK